MKPAANRMRGLHVCDSRIPGAGMGLFTTGHIQRGQAIGVYTGDVLDLGVWEKDHYGVEIADSGMVMSPFTNGDVDFDLHPFAAANEPEIGGGGPNMALREETHDNGHVSMHILVFYAVKNIEANSELLWCYGGLYERSYETDLCDEELCTMRFPKLSEARVERLARERPDGVHMLPESESSQSSSHDSDPSFTPAL